MCVCLSVCVRLSGKGGRREEEEGEGRAGGCGPDGAI